MPTFGVPGLTSTLAEVGTGHADPALTGLEPLPDLVDPELPPVAEPSDEPLVAVAHRRIRVLASYWHGGWHHARPGCWLRASVLDRLGAAADSLPDHWGLAVFDGWRPLDLQAELYDAAYRDADLPEGFVAYPDPDPTTPPPHLTGGAVDLTLTRDGTPLALGTGFDDFSALAWTDALEGTPGADRDARRLLYGTMRDQGFVVLDCEWWHFEHGTRLWGALTGGSPSLGPTEPPG